MPVYGSDREILETALAWISAGHRPALVTVVKTWGSSPRPVGSLMLMRDDGVHTGSVSGGCVEEDLLERYRKAQLADDFPTLLDYGVNREQAGRFGLPCGGRLELLVEQLQAAGQLELLLDRLGSGEPVSRRVCLNTGEVSLHPATAVDDFSYTPDAVTKVFGPQWTLLLIGAGHLSRCVAQIAVMMDYRVVVCDPRDSHAKDWALDGVQRVSLMPDEAVQALACHARGSVVALTHDPRLDDMALMDALDSKAFYVGALGSKRSSEARRERLKALGVSTRQLQRLHAPVGLAIGSRTAPEIAVSIMAELTAERREAARRTADQVTAV